MKARLTLWLLVAVWALAGAKRAAPPLERRAGAARPPALGGADKRARIAAHCRPRRALLEQAARGTRGWSAESHAIAGN